MSGSNTESFGSVSSGSNSEVEVVESQTDEEKEGPIPILSVPGTQATRTGLESLDAVDLLEVWKVRPVLMQCPQILQRRVLGCVLTSVGREGHRREQARRAFHMVVLDEVSAWRQALGRRLHQATRERCPR